MFIDTWVLVLIGWVVCGVWAYGRCYYDTENRVTPLFALLAGPIGALVGLLLGAASKDFGVRYRKEPVYTAEPFSIPAAPVYVNVERIKSLERAITTILSRVSLQEDISSYYSGQGTRITRLIDALGYEEVTEAAQPERTVIRKKQTKK